jgi:hypothetical protein
MRTQIPLCLFPIKRILIGLHSESGGSNGQSDAPMPTLYAHIKTGIRPKLPGQQSLELVCVRPRSSSFLKARATSISIPLNGDTAVESGRVADPTNTTAYISQGKISSLDLKSKGNHAGLDPALNVVMLPSETFAHCQYCMRNTHKVKDNPIKFPYVEPSLRLSAFLVASFCTGWKPRRGTFAQPRGILNLEAFREDAARWAGWAFT